MLRNVAAILFIALLAGPVLAKPVLNVGSISPPFELPDLDGKTVDLQDYLGNNVVVLSFFASWSKSCQQEIIFLEELSKKYNQNNLKIIAISYDRKLEDLKSFVSENNLSIKILLDKKLKTLKDYRILIIPTLFLIDRSGNIKSVYVDFDSNVEKAVSQEIEKLLAPPEHK